MLKRNKEGRREENKYISEAQKFPSFLLAYTLAGAVFFVKDLLFFGCNNFSK